MTAKTIEKVFESFKNKNILIIGDVMIDAYVIGNVDRISPEAPVPVVSVGKRTNRMGGAANVALNIKSLGAKPFLCSIIGDDVKGNEFIELLKEQEMSPQGIIKSTNRPTTTKFRIIGNNVQMLRVDEEVTQNINKEEEKKLFDKISSIIETEDISAIIFEDYDKGCITPTLIKKVIQLATQKNIITTVDPKKRNFNHYNGVTLLKPNFKELKEGLSLDIENGDIQTIRDVAIDFLGKNKISILMITLSEHGVLICERNMQTHIPANIRNIADVSGAGDTVISTLTLALAAGLTPVDAAKISNLAGGLVCEEIGVVPIDKEKLMKESKNILK